MVVCTVGQTVDQELVVVTADRAHCSEGERLWSQIQLTIKQLPSFLW